MSALGHKRTGALQNGMSATPESGHLQRTGACPLSAKSRHVSVTNLFALDEYCRALQCALKTDSRSKTIPPSGILPCEGRPPIRRAWTIVPDFELLWRGTSTLETSLWLAAQRDH